VKGCEIMQKVITVKEIEETINNYTDIEEPIIVKRENKSDLVIMSMQEYEKVFHMTLDERLKIAEEQIKNGEVVDGDIVLAEMREKYGYK